MMSRNKNAINDVICGLERPARRITEEGTRRRIHFNSQQAGFVVSACTDVIIYLNDTFDQLCTINSKAIEKTVKIVSYEKVFPSICTFLSSQYTCRCTPSDQMVEHGRRAGHQDLCTVLCNHVDLQNNVNIVHSQCLTNQLFTSHSKLMYMEGINTYVHQRQKYHISHHRGVTWFVHL